MPDKFVGTDITTVGTITAGTWNGGTIAIARGGTGSTTKNFVDLTTDQTVDGTKQFQKAATNATAFNAGTSLTIDFGRSNLAYTSGGGASPGYTLSNLKDGGAYTLVMTSASNSGIPLFTATGFTFKNMGVVAMTATKHHIFSFIAIGSTVYISMATEN